MSKGTIFYIKIVPAIRPVTGHITVLLIQNFVIVLCCKKCYIFLYQTVAFIYLFLPTQNKNFHASNSNGRY